MSYVTHSRYSLYSCPPRSPSRNTPRYNINSYFPFMLLSSLRTHLPSYSGQVDRQASRPGVSCYPSSGFKHGADWGIGFTGINSVHYFTIILVLIAVILCTLRIKAFLWRVTWNAKRMYLNTNYDGNVTHWIYEMCEGYVLYLRYECCFLLTFSIFHWIRKKKRALGYG